MKLIYTFFLLLGALAFGQVNPVITWNDNSDNETGFRIERSVGAGSTAFIEVATVGANIVTYQTVGQSYGTTYRYRVRAYNASGASAYTNILDYTTPPQPPPNAPTNLRVELSVTTIKAGDQITVFATDESGRIPKGKLAGMKFSYSLLPDTSLLIESVR